MLTTPNLLFYISRSSNSNVVVYTYNKLGKFDLDINSPINSYWIMREKPGNPTEELTYMEKKMAYGHDITEIFDNQNIYFTISPLKDDILTIKLNPQSKFRCYYKDPESSHEYILKKVYVDTTESLIGLPSVNFIDLILEDSDGNIIKKQRTP